jgi:hypothetical protein
MEEKYKRYLNELYKAGLDEDGIECIERNPISFEDFCKLEHGGRLLPAYNNQVGIYYLHFDSDYNFGD